MRRANSQHGQQSRPQTGITALFGLATKRLTEATFCHLLLRVLLVLALLLEALLGGLRDLLLDRRLIKATDGTRTNAIKAKSEAGFKILPAAHPRSRDGHGYR